MFSVSFCFYSYLILKDSCSFLLKHAHHLSLRVTGSDVFSVAFVFLNKRSFFPHVCVHDLPTQSAPSQSRSLFEKLAGSLPRLYCSSFLWHFCFCRHLRFSLAVLAVCSVSNRDLVPVSPDVCLPVGASLAVVTPHRPSWPSCVCPGQMDDVLCKTK